MGKVLLDAGTHDKLGLIAAAWGVDEGQAVAELITRLGGPRAVPSPVVGNIVPIHFDYRGVHTEADYDRKSQSVTITSGKLAGQKFPKPSPAARAVVGIVADDVNPHRNGWRCWIVTATGEPLESIRGA